MVGCFVAFIAQIAGYTSILVFETPKGDSPMDRGYVTAKVLTDQEVVAGYYAESTGVHGETMFAKPFAWQRGKLYWLPLGKAQYGRVYAGNDSVLVGEIMTNYETRPAKWTPDAKLGWSKSRLTEVGSDSGYAVAVTESGDIWVKNAESIERIGATSERVPIDKFDIVGVEKNGRIWGNLYTGLGQGMMRLGESAAFIDGGKVNVYSKARKIAAVNTSGDICGMELEAVSGQLFRENRPFVRLQGKETTIPLPKNRFCNVADLNENGDVVGTLNVPTGSKDPEFHNIGFLFRANELKLLSAPWKDASDFTASCINKSGAIVGSSTLASSERLYLLRPR